MNPGLEFVFTPDSKKVLEPGSGDLKDPEKYSGVRLGVLDCAGGTE